MTPRVFVALLDEMQEFQRMQAADARAAAKRNSLTVDVASAENNGIMQIHQLFERLHAPEAERPVAIVVNSVAVEGQERVARNALKAGIGWISLNRPVSYLEGLRREWPDLPVCSVTVHQAEIGRIHARQVRALIKERGLILYVQGPLDTTAAKDRLEAARQGLADFPLEWRIVNADWTEAGAESATAAWLRLQTAERPALIVAQGDAMAVGARRAALAHDKTWASIPVIGCDALPETGQRLVESGDMAASVVRPSSSGPAIDIIARWLRTRETPPAELVPSPRSLPPESELRPRA